MPAEPYLTNRSNAQFLTESPRRVPQLTILDLAGPLIIPGLLVALGIWVAANQVAGDGSVLAALGLFGAAAIFAHWGLSDSWRDNRLLREGRVILGEVVSFSVVTSTGRSEPSAGGGGEPWVQVTVTMGYAFHTPDNVRRTGISVKVYTSARSEPDVRPGDAMAVLYLDGTLYRVL